MFKSVCEALLANSSDIRARVVGARYDAVIIDVLLNECGLALAHSVVKAPVLIGFWAYPCTGGGGEMIFSRCDSHLSPQWFTGLNERMNFFQRIYNFIQRFLQKTFMVYHAALMDYFISEHVEGAPSSVRVLGSMQKFIVNGDGIVDYSRRMPPDFLNAAGMQIKKKLDETPAFLSDWLDSARDGVILLALPCEEEEQRLATILAALSSLAQKVVFEFESPEKISHLLPSNVLCMKHAPRQEILAHPETALFFTRFNVERVVEGVFYGVPVFGWPVHPDQSNLAALVEYRGIGSSVDPRWVGKQQLREAIERVLNSVEIKKRVKKMSSLMKDGWRLHPLDRAVHLVERASEKTIENVLGKEDSNQNDFRLLSDIFLPVSVMSAVFCAAEFIFNRLSL